MFVITASTLRLQFDSFTGQPSAEEQTRQMIERLNINLQRHEGSPQIFLTNPRAITVETAHVTDGTEHEETEIAREEGNLHGEDETHKREDWREDVASKNTQLGYWDWVSHQRDSAATTST